MRQLLECPHCLSEVKYGASVCVGCGAEVSYGQSKLGLIGKFVLIFFIMTSILSSALAYLMNTVGIDANGSISGILNLVFLIASIALSWLVFSKFVRRPDQILFRRYNRR